MASNSVTSVSRLEAGLRRSVAVLDKLNVFHGLTRFIGLIIIVLMAAIISVDVILRYFFGLAIGGSIEIIGICVVIGVFFSIAYTQMKKGHITIDIITSQLSQRVQLLMNIIMYFVSVALFASMSYATWDYFLYNISMNRLSWVLAIPLWPYVFIVWLGLTALLLVIIRDLLNYLADGVKSRFGGGQWALTLGISALSVAGFVWWTLVPTPGISTATIGLVGLIAMFVFLFCGMPVSFILMMISFVFVGHISGWKGAIDIGGATLFINTYDYTWAVAALFSLMSYFVVAVGLGADLFTSANKWIGHIRGGLLVATIGASTIFGAVVSSPTTSTIAIGAVAHPEMMKYKYDPAISTGTITTSSLVGNLIPPSLAFIIYGLLSGSSIAELFIAGIIPGLLLSAGFVGYVLIRCGINPALGPAGRRATWKERFMSLKAVLPILILFVFIHHLGECLPELKDNLTHTVAYDVYRGYRENLPTGEVAWVILGNSPSYFKSASANPIIDLGRGG